LSAPIRVTLVEESIPGMHGLEQQPQSGVGRVFSRLGGLQDTAQLLNTPPSTYTVAMTPSQTTEVKVEFAPLSAEPRFRWLQQRMLGL
jgi:hypothetical protein